MIRLTDLQPCWLIAWPGLAAVAEDGTVRFSRTPSAEFAQGIEFICPLCLERNGGEPHGVHRLICWGDGVPAGVPPGPGRWRLVGTSFHDLTLEAAPGLTRSVRRADCGWHGTITNGEVRNLARH